MDEPLLPVSAPAAGEEVYSPGDAPEKLSPSPPESPLPTATVLVRLASLAALSLLSLWANYEASRGFGVDVVNAAAGTPAGRKFDLMFVSNGRATRSVLDASGEVERALYPGGGADEGKRPVQHVTLRLSYGNVSAGVAVLQDGRGVGLHGENRFVIHVSSRVMLAADANEAMRAAIRRGMARVWLWDGQGAAPEALLDAMAEYLAMSASLKAAARRDPVGSPGAATTMEGREESSCWPAAAHDRDAAVDFVRLCEARSRGFVARLNRAMRWEWRPDRVEEALGSPPGRLCGTHSTSAWGGGAASPVGDGPAGGTVGNGHVTSKGWASA